MVKNFAPDAVAEQLTAASGAKWTHDAAAKRYVTSGEDDVVNSLAGRIQLAADQAGIVNADASIRFEENKLMLDASLAENAAFRQKLASQLGADRPKTPIALLEREAAEIVPVAARR